jgi:uncharacterized protein (TIGR02328 family)
MVYHALTITGIPGTPKQAFAKSAINCSELKVCNKQTCARIGSGHGKNEAEKRRNRSESQLALTLGNKEAIMRLWHIALLPKLSDQHLLGQHREVCALRGLGWGKKHSTVDYVFTHNPIRLWAYHIRVMSEMITRGFKPDLKWVVPVYRGFNSPPWDEEIMDYKQVSNYPEHNDEYLQECINNLILKGFTHGLNGKDWPLAYASTTA